MGHSSDIFTVLPDDFPPLDKDGTYRFTCQRCGECCFDQLVLLEPQDVYRLARAGVVAGDKTTTQLFAKGIVALEFLGEGWRCVLKQEPFGKRGTKCTFLMPELNRQDQVKGFVCSVHNVAKPLVCTLSPVAIGQSYDDLRLVPPVADCPGMGKGSDRPVSEALAGLDDTLALSRYFQENIAPLISGDEALTRKAYDFDAHAQVDSFDQLLRYLRYVVRQSK